MSLATELHIIQFDSRLAIGVLALNWVSLPFEVEVGRDHWFLFSFLSNANFVLLNTFEIQYFPIWMEICASSKFPGSEMSAASGSLSPGKFVKRLCIFLPTSCYIYSLYKYLFSLYIWWWIFIKTKWQSVIIKWQRVGKEPSSKISGLAAPSLRCSDPGQFCKFSKFTPKLGKFLYKAPPSTQLWQRLRP